MKKKSKNKIKTIFAGTLNQRNKETANIHLFLLGHNLKKPSPSVVIGGIYPDNMVKQIQRRTYLDPVYVFVSLIPTKWSLGLCQSFPSSDNSIWLCWTQAGHTRWVDMDRVALTELYQTQKNKRLKQPGLNEHMVETHIRERDKSVQNWKWKKNAWLGIYLSGHKCMPSKYEVMSSNPVRKIKKERMLKIEVSFKSCL